MTNPSLQEQLQALVPNPETTEKKGDQSHSTSKKGPASQSRYAFKPGLKKPSNSKPSWLEYFYYGIELLKAYFPACFKEAREIKPLKIGIKQDLVKHLGTREDIIINDKACMIKSLSYYVNTINYYKNVIEGVLRIDLEGKEAGVVSPEEALYSAQQYQLKLQKKSSRSRPDGKKSPE